MLNYYQIQDQKKVRNKNLNQKVENRLVVVLNEREKQLLKLQVGGEVIVKDLKNQKKNVEDL